MTYKASDELWVLFRLIDGSDPVWDHCTTMMGTKETIRRMFDLSKGVPFGWRLLKGKQARRWLRDSLKAELRYQRDRKAREKAGDN
jgi:hypothetical protein